MSAPSFGPAAQEQLCRNAARLLQAALQRDSAGWAEEDAATSAASPSPEPPEPPSAPLLDLARMDLGMLDGLQAWAAPPPPDAAALQTALHAVQDRHPELPSLAGLLSDDGFDRWLALYRQGEPAVVEAVTLAHRLMA